MSTYSSCFSISREAACQVSKSGYTHREMSICCTISCSLVFMGHFRSWAQALPERLQTEGDTSFHGQLLPEVCWFYQKRIPKYLISRLAFLDLHTHLVQITWQSVLARGPGRFWQFTVSKKLLVTFVNFSVCDYKWTFSPLLKYQ